VSYVTDVDREKVTYERLDTILSALPENSKDEFIELIRDLNYGNSDSVSYRSVYRWLRRH
jgi:hypothetical protein